MKRNNVLIEGNIKRILFVFLCFIILSVYSCNKNKIENYDNLIGFWIESNTDDSLITYNKVNELSDTKPGFIFITPDIFVERKSVGGWNVLPYYANFDGTWERNDSIINIEVASWEGGLGVEYKWEIVSINNNKLQIVKLEQEYHETE